jgi:ABC-type uncharacterized transport system substrate-binding protein
VTSGTALTRRLVLAAIPASLLPRATRAQQQPARHRIGFLATGSFASNVGYIGAFREGLRALGYGDKDITIEIRYGDGYLERLPGLATELVQLAPEVIVAGSPPAAFALNSPLTKSVFDQPAPR